MHVPDSEKFDLLRVGLGKIDDRVNKIDDRVNKVEDRSQDLQLGIAAVSDRVQAAKSESDTLTKKVRSELETELDDMGDAITTLSNALLPEPESQLTVPADTRKNRSSLYVGFGLSTAVALSGLAFVMGSPKIEKPAVSPFSSDISKFPQLTPPISQEPVRTQPRNPVTPKTTKPKLQVNVKREANQPPQIVAFNYVKPHVASSVKSKSSTATNRPSKSEPAKPAERKEPTPNPTRTTATRPQQTGGVVFGTPKLVTTKPATTIDPEKVGGAGVTATAASTGGISPR